MAYGNDEQRSHAEKDAVSCFDISAPQYLGLRVNNMENVGCAGAMRYKAPVAPQGHSKQATGNAEARSPAQPECPSYSFAGS
jgi:hypothetical protein